MGIGSNITKRLAPRVTDIAPDLTANFVREALKRALDGVGPLQPAKAAAARQLEEQRGDVDRAIHEIIENNVRLAGGQGFLTNLGGLATATVAIPANIMGLAILQCRMIAGIAHVRGYDIDDSRVRNAILACLLGEESVDELVKKKKLAAPPMALATSPGLDPSIDKVLAGVVAAELVGRVAGKRLAVTAGRRVPLIGGLVGAGADGYSTWRVGRYAERELLPRAAR